MRILLMTVLILVLLPLVTMALKATFGCSVGELLDDVLTLHQEQNRLKDLTVKAERLKPRLDAEGAIVAGLSTQNTSLTDAIRRIRELWIKEELDAAIDKLKKERYPEARSREEVLCRHLICTVASRLQLESNPRQEEVVAGLEAEMAAYLCEKSLVLEEKGRDR
jgi:hypothetical protein